MTFAGGTLHRHADFASQVVAPRHVDVWRPPAYDTADPVRFPVLYMHDGQNLFDPSLANTGIDWGVDEAVATLTAEGATAGVIVVGVWNTADRVLEYAPAHPISAGRGMLDRYIRKWGSAPRSGAYLKFLVEELKPFIDATYRTQPDPAHTAIMGSSMGGLISLYALTIYPEVFGGAGCLSTHWTEGGNDLVDFFGAALPPPGSHRLYFDFGTAGLDAGYEPYQQRMDAHLAAAGYRRGRDWLTLKFDGADHNEAAWRARLAIPLRFLLTGRPSPDPKGFQNL